MPPGNSAKSQGAATGVATFETDRGSLDHPVIFFDGVCGLCNRTVNFILPRDKARVFRFAPLQGETARAVLSPSDVDDLETLVVNTGTARLRRSSAVVYILRRLPGIWPLVGSLLWLIPRPIRNFGYNLIARNRYRLFGKKEACRMPLPEERAVFLP